MIFVSLHATTPLRLSLSTLVPLKQVSSEALRVCEEFVVVLSPAVGAQVSPALKPLIRPLYTAITERLNAKDQDQVGISRIYLASGC